MTLQSTLGVASSFGQPGAEDRVQGKAGMNLLFKAGSCDEPENATSLHA